MNISLSVKNWVQTKYSQFLGQYRILPYLFVNTLFNGHSIGSGLTKLGSENDKLFV